MWLSKRRHEKTYSILQYLGWICWKCKCLRKVTTRHVSAPKGCSFYSIKLLSTHKKLFTYHPTHTDTHTHTNYPQTLNPFNLLVKPQEQTSISKHTHTETYPRYPHPRAHRAEKVWKTLFQKREEIIFRFLANREARVQHRRHHPYRLMPIN